TGIHAEELENRQEKKNDAVVSALAKSLVGHSATNFLYSFPMLGLSHRQVDYTASDILLCAPVGFSPVFLLGAIYI
ncbi:MAG: hypothetical protein OXI59_23115, partial [Gemmatimonadota bacterium]|nr:hypothetical protein [Gemmatimonadota bacterium]